MHAPGAKFDRAYFTIGKVDINGEYEEDEGPEALYQRILKNIEPRIIYIQPKFIDHFIKITRSLPFSCASSPYDRSFLSFHVGYH